MSDIVERLRSGDFFSEADCLEAAAEIEKLRGTVKYLDAENDKLTEGQFWEAQADMWHANYSELHAEFERLRAENEELKRLNGNCDRHIKEVHAAYMLEHSGLRSEIEELRAALKPFEIIAQWDAEDRVLVPVYIIRAAAAALKETGDE